MKREIIAGVGVIAVAVFVFGCQKKPKDQEMVTVAPVKEEASTPQVQTQVQTLSTQTAPAAGLENAGVPEVAAKPSETEIQQALKNTGLYDGAVDGKIGPKTKKAIEDFQTKNNLTADGKVGPKTWDKLKEYLSAKTESSSAQGITN